MIPFSVEKTNLEDNYLARRDSNFLMINDLVLGNQIEALDHLEVLDMQTKTLDNNNFHKKLAFLNNIAVGHYVLENKVEAKEAIEAIEEMMGSVNSASARFKIVELLNTRAIFEIIKGTQQNYENAIKHLNDAIERIEKVSRTCHKSENVILNNLAISYSLVGRHLEAKNTIVNMYSKIKHESQKKPIYMINLAIIISKSGDFKMADKIVDKIKVRIES